MNIKFQAVGHLNRVMNIQAESAHVSNSKLCWEQYTLMSCRARPINTWLIDTTVATYMIPYLPNAIPWQKHTQSMLFLSCPKIKKHPLTGICRGRELRYSNSGLTAHLVKTPHWGSHRTLQLETPHLLLHSPFVCNRILPHEMGWQHFW